MKSAVRVCVCDFNPYVPFHHYRISPFNVVIIYQIIRPQSYNWIQVLTMSTRAYKRSLVSGKSSEIGQLTFGIWGKPSEACVWKTLFPPDWGHGNIGSPIPSAQEDAGRCRHQGCSACSYFLNKGMRAWADLWSSSDALRVKRKTNNKHITEETPISHTSSLHDITTLAKQLKSLQPLSPLSPHTLSVWCLTLSS